MKRKLFAVVCCLALLFGGCARQQDGPSAPELLYGPGCEDAYAVIRLNNFGEHAELCQMAISEDREAVDAYLQRLGDDRITREDLSFCVDTLNALPYLSILEGEITRMECYPRESFFTVTVEGANGDTAELVYEPARDPAAYPAGPLHPFTCCDGRVTVYREERKREPGEGGRDYILWHAAADGVCLRVFYYTDAPERIVAEDMFDGVKVVAVMDRLSVTGA